jgi:heat shock protein HtpX
VVFVVVLVGLGALAWYGGDRRALGAIGGSVADPVVHARLINLVEGLAIGAGVHQPRLVVVDDPALNAMAFGRDTQRATVVVTSGLLEGLNRIELEGVVAEELAQIRQLDILPATVAVGTFGLGASLAVPTGRAAAADLAAVALTRYPPGLLAAFEKMAAKGTAVRSVPGSVAHLWLADARSTSSATHRGATSSRPPLSERIEALREL